MLPTLRHRGQTWGEKRYRLILVCTLRYLCQGQGSWWSQNCHAVVSQDSARSWCCRSSGECQRPASQLAAGTPVRICFKERKKKKMVYLLFRVPQLLLHVLALVKKPQTLWVQRIKVYQILSPQQSTEDCGYSSFLLFFFSFFGGGLANKRKLMWLHKLLWCPWHFCASLDSKPSLNNNINCYKNAITDTQGTVPSEIFPPLLL